MEPAPTVKPAVSNWEDEGGSLIHSEPSLPRHDGERPSPSVASPSTVALVVETHLPPPVRETVALLDGGEQAYPRMLDSIARARSSIELEVYAFSHQGIGKKFIEALGQAAARGVNVRVVIDGWGSARSGATVAQILRESGCQARVFHRLLSILKGRVGRNHRKILLVDERVAFLGGINIGDENLSEGARIGWADIALEIRGPQCARLAAMLHRRRPQNVPSSLRIFLSGIGGGWRLRRRYIEAFENATKRIDLAHGYFLPDRGIVNALVAAAGRGVRVRLLLAGQSDVPFARAATRRLYGRLLSAGVLIFEWQGSVLHAKLATIDAERLLVGSFNLDPFSLANLETLVEADDLKVAQKASEWLEDHMMQARAMTSQESGSFIWRYLIDPFGYVVARFTAAMGRVMAGRARRHSARVGMTGSPPK